MKLPEHVDYLRNLITAAFDKQISRLGFGSSRQIPIEKFPQELHASRHRFEEMLQSHLGETGSYQEAREKLLDEFAFTLFNRIAAVKVMEAAKFFPPIITRLPEHGGRSFGHKAWLEIRPDIRSEELEGIREYILHAFNELGESLPLFSRNYPYALLPDAISLNEIIDAFNQLEKDPQVGMNIWESDDILGWLYESYNNAKKAEFKDSGEKTEYDKVSLQSQVYTPRWVVQFLVDNSLGKLYLEMYPDSEIKDRFKIANAPKTQERTPKPLHEVKLIDPACGSGNFLLYAFDLFYKLYLDQIENYGADYEERNIPALIIEKNLHGIDLDDRAVQLAQLGLYIKARMKRSNVTNLEFNVVSSDFYLPEYERVHPIFENGTELDRNQKALIAEIWSDLRFAYKFGSLIRLDEKLKARFRELVSKREIQKQLFTDKELGIKPKPVQQELFLEHDIERERIFAKNFFFNLKVAVEQHAHTTGNTFLASKTRDAIIFLELLNTEYDVAVANPPYTDSSDFGPELREFIQDNYKKPQKFHTNLYATFIKRCYEFVSKDGMIGLIHPRTFMFIKTFEDVRKFIINKTNINVFADYGLSDLFGSIMVDPAFYVLEKSSLKEPTAWFIFLDQYTRTPNEKFKQEFCIKALNDHVAGIENKHNYIIYQSKLKVVKSWPFIYWISDDFREKLSGPNLDAISFVRQGGATGNNLRTLRLWWEIDKASLSNSLGDKKKWVIFQKGGSYCKWYGNNWVVIAYNDPRTYKYLKEHGNSLPSEQHYLKEGITYTDPSSKGTAFRYMPPNHLISGAGPGIYPNEYKNVYYLLGFLNSTLTRYIASCLNSTVHTTQGDIKKFPFVHPSDSVERIVTLLSKLNVLIKESLCSYHIIEKNYTETPLTAFNDVSLKERIKQFLNYENHLLAQVLISEAIISDKMFDVYKLTERDRVLIKEKEGENIGGMPVFTEARNAYLADTQAVGEFHSNHISDFIKTLPVIDFSIDKQTAIENEFDTLYQSNNDLEEFCIRHQVNPINVWYWFKQSNTIPQQRMHTIALEFLTDIIREILLEDDDGIIPLVPNAGGKVLLDCIEEKFREIGFSMAQYSSFDTLLGKPLNECLNRYFFSELSDHLNLFMYLPKTPFIWHLSSGPEQGFDCYIIIYKWNRNKLLRLRSVYLENRERSLINRESDLAKNNSAEAQNEKDKIFKQLKEIETFKEKIDQLLAEGYDPVLDDGVGKNIAPLQQKKLISYDVLIEGQLTKYLNADW